MIKKTKEPKVPKVKKITLKEVRKIQNATVTQVKKMNDMVDLYLEQNEGDQFKQAEAGASLFGLSIMSGEPLSKKNGEVGIVCGGGAQPLIENLIVRFKDKNSPSSLGRLLGL